MRPRLVGRDKSPRRGKGHLKSRSHHAFRLKQDDSNHRNRKGPHRDRRPVKQHCAKHHGRHDESPLRRHARTRQDEIGEAGQQGRHRCRLLHRHAQRQRLEQHEGLLRQEEHKTPNNPHVQAGDGEQVRETRSPQRLLVLFRHEAAIPRDERRSEPTRALACGNIHMRGEVPPEG